MNDNRPYYAEVIGHGPCKTCGAMLGHPCRTKRGGPAGRPHKARVDAYEADQAVVREEHRIAASRTENVERCLGARRIDGAVLPPMSALHDVPPDVPIFLTGDQAGPHGHVEGADAYSVAVIDSALNVRVEVLITFPSMLHENARLWCESQTDVLFARYVGADGVEYIGWPTRTGIEWKEAQPA